MTGPHILDPARLLGEAWTDASAGSDAQPAANHDQRLPVC